MKAGMRRLALLVLIAAGAPLLLVSTFGLDAEPELRATYEGGNASEDRQHDSRRDEHLDDRIAAIGWSAALDRWRRSPRDPLRGPPTPRDVVTHGA